VDSRDDTGMLCCACVRSFACVIKTTKTYPILEINSRIAYTRTWEVGFVLRKFKPREKDQWHPMDRRQCGL
jgi:hypothetical protein